MGIKKMMFRIQGSALYLLWH